MVTWDLDNVDQHLEPDTPGTDNSGLGISLLPANTNDGTAALMNIYFGGEEVDFDSIWKAIPDDVVDPLPHESLNTLGMDPSQSITSFSTSPANDNAEGSHPNQLFNTSGTGHSQIRINIPPPPANTNNEQMEEGSGSNPPEQLTRMEIDIINPMGSKPFLREKMEEWSGSNSPEIDAVLSQIDFSTSPANDNAEGPPPHQLFDTSGTGNSQLGINSLLANTNDEQMEEVFGSNPPEQLTRTDKMPSEFDTSEPTGSQDPDPVLTTEITYNIEGPPPANTNEEQMTELSGSNSAVLIRMEKLFAKFDIREPIGSQDPDPFLREALELELDEFFPVLYLAQEVVEDYYEKGIRPQDLDYLRLISHSVSRTVDRFQGHYNMLNGLIYRHESVFEDLQDISERLKKIIIREKEVHPSTPEQLSVTSGEKQARLYIAFEDIKKPLQLSTFFPGTFQILKAYGMCPSPRRTTFSFESFVYRMIYDTDELEALMIYLKDCKSKFAWFIEDFEQDVDAIPCPVTLMPLKDFTPRFSAVDEPFYSLTYHPTAIFMITPGILAVLQTKLSLDVCSNGKSSINVANSYRIIIAEMKLRIPRDISLPQKRRRAKIDVPLVTLLKHCNKTLEQAAHDIGVSESKLKDVVKEHGYGGWKDFTIKSKNSPKLVLLEAENAQPSVASSSFLHVDGGSQHRMQPISSSATETNSKPVMLRYGKFTYEFDLTSDSKIEDLEREVTEREKDLPVGSFYMEYKNREGVWIRIACYDDMRRCMDSLTSSAGYAVEMRVTKKRRVNKGN